MPRTRRMTETELRAFGERLRKYRKAAGVTQAELAERRCSHAYISALEAGKREPSAELVAHFANKLRVPVETLWVDKGVDWTMQLAKDLRSKGKVRDGRALLIETLTNLDRDRQVNRRALVLLHRELGRLEEEQGRRAGAVHHYAAALELIQGDDDAMAADAAELLVRLGDLQVAQRKKSEALTQYRAASHLLLELMGRSIEQSPPDV